MNLEASSSKENTASALMFRIPGLEAMIQLLRREFLQLSGMAIARILGLPTEAADAAEHMPDTRDLSQSTSVSETQK